MLLSHVCMVGTVRIGWLISPAHAPRAGKGSSVREFMMSVYHQTNVPARHNVSTFSRNHFASNEKQRTEYFVTLYSYFSV